RAGEEESVDRQSCAERSARRGQPSGARKGCALASASSGRDRDSRRREREDGSEGEHGERESATSFAHVRPPLFRGLLPISRAACPAASLSLSLAARVRRRLSSAIRRLATVYSHPWIEAGASRRSKAETAAKNACCVNSSASSWLRVRRRTNRYRSRRWRRNA